MNVRNIIYGAHFIILVGCAAQPRVEVPSVVEVPIALACPKPELPQRPHFPIRDLNEHSYPADVARAWAASLNACTGYAESLEVLLK